MNSSRFFLRFLLLPGLLLNAILSSADAKPAAPQAPSSQKPLPHMSKETRFSVYRGLEAELVYVRTAFPMGEKGLKLHDGVVSPSGDELQMMIANFGPSVKAGDQARISKILIKDKSITFEINGGPRKKKKWYERISVGGVGGEVPVAPTDADANPRGSYVVLQFDGYVPDLDVAALKGLLRPVFDFDAKSGVEAYLETVPPKVKEAIQLHRVLVGMNREMVTYAKGKPPRKLREKDGEVEFEEWIYGAPPQDVEFIRLVGDEVVRLEVMKVGGEKMVRTEKEVDLTPSSAVAEQKPEVTPLPAKKPTLKRVGEEDDPADTATQAGRVPRRKGDPPPKKDDPTAGPNMFLGV